MLIVLLLLLFELFVALFVFMLALGYNARALELSELCAGIFLQIIHYQLRLSCGHLAFAVDTFTRGCLAAGVQKLHEFVCLHVLAVREHD